MSPKTLGSDILIEVESERRRQTNLYSSFDHILRCTRKTE